MRRVRPPAPEHLKFLSAYEPRITELALATRRLVLEEAPDTTELIYDAYSAVTAGYSFTGRPSDAFLYVAAYPRGVNLGFHQGVLLADPHKLLEGAGRWARHIKIRDLTILKNLAVREIVQSAIAIAERPDPQADRNTMSGKSVVRAIYAKKRRPIQAG